MAINHTLFELKTVANTLYNEANKTLNNVGLTSNQASILIYILNNGKDKEITQKNLQDVFKVKHSTISGIIKRMEEKGFIETYQNPNDKRNVFVKNSDKSMAIIEEIKSTNELMPKIFSVLTKAEIEKFIDTIHKIYLNI